MLVFPAHGALGALDEVIFLGVVVIFVGMMAISWMRSRDAVEETPSDTVTPDSPSIPDENRFELK
jgi:hypothetical protein